MKNLISLRFEAENEAYTYFDQNIRKLPRNENGSWDFTTGEYSNNDVDAFRHAYVSGVFTQEYNSLTADIFSLLTEVFGVESLADHKMDLWNNSIGRKYGKKTKSKAKLAVLLKKALQNNELIIISDDPRPYTGLFQYEINDKKPVIVLKKSKSGCNEIFYDLIKKIILTRAEFISQIQLGQYPGYKLVMLKNGLTPMSKQDSTINNNLG